ncbi:MULTISPECIES: hypothetical protein [unclassified Lysobacter]|uniref:hypothetical protein n=1 Tax=unclassified Lysobacter TaxID=2635362 RepID=UPI001BE539E0|nr:MULTISPECIES: hypothetical protein [unclassified Lysobacter]MBT2746588.1 hypothetical protein [Lysobacter sp. ISL-42]MBT2753417.1 hypothetical protein [Lysobacter sp. ISL-50]MBT2775527.1 hypothetical protein [Lysobacter sp. ISL-54]MBT2782937.1 hypothetical protein [Lysobacter sp. ISL-52]
MIFLIHYNRKLGALVSVATYQDSERLAASQAKMSLEVSLLGSNGASEVVLLEAETEEDLRKTHGRYFKTLEELKVSERKS